MSEKVIRSHTINYLKKIYDVCTHVTGVHDLNEIFSSGLTILPPKAEEHLNTRLLVRVVRETTKIHKLLLLPLAAPQK